MKTKTKFIIMLLVSMATAYSSSVVAQDGTKSQIKTIVGTFDGYDEEDGYSFLILDEEDGNEKYMFFTKITDEALKMVNLKSKAMEGQKFELSYSTRAYTEKDDSGIEETYEEYTITEVKKV
ncbi:hypothetical protein Q2T40_15600 [Winogradskyella maritima]|uniref:Uncharacterized protein n=1 Tax=Winogradskyella maritima TaxID=1517766 RepID=A0ABV8AFV6_9FLAO|nr:hypothetical protein [Winogradskyella maritima]